MQNLLTQLWRDVFGEPPPLADDSELLTRILVENLPAAPPYEPVDLRVLTRRDPRPKAAPEPSDEDEARRA